MLFFLSQAVGFFFFLCSNVICYHGLTFLPQKELVLLSFFSQLSLISHCVLSHEAFKIRNNLGFLQLLSAGVVFILFVFIRNG